MEVNQPRTLGFDPAPDVLMVTILERHLGKVQFFNSFLDLRCLGTNICLPVNMINGHPGHATCDFLY